MTFFDDQSIDAADFLIAHELSHILKGHTLWKIAETNVLAFACLGMMYGLHRFNIPFGQVKRFAAVHALARLGIVVFPLGSLSTKFNHYLEIDADRSAASLGCNYVQGGLERFVRGREYNKFLLHNYTEEIPRDYVPLHLRNTPEAAAEYLRKRHSGTAWTQTRGPPSWALLLGILPDGDTQNPSHPMYATREAVLYQVGSNLGCDRSL